VPHRGRGRGARHVWWEGRPKNGAMVFPSSCHVKAGHSAYKLGYRICLIQPGRYISSNR
jgi:hypothetical protein